MKNLKIIIKIFIINLLLIFIFSYSKLINANENKILFKINKKAFTSLDYEKRIKYLDFVGSNYDLNEKVIMDDFVSVNLFHEYYLKSKNNNNFDNKINEIFTNITNANKKNNKKYKYDIVKEDILFNIRLDFIRKSILENILNANRNNLILDNEEIDLLYNFKIKYVNFESKKLNEIKQTINNLEFINYQNIVEILNENKINFFIKEKEISNIQKIDKRIRDNILANNNFIFFENNDKISLIFIKKQFETLNGVLANLYSIKSEIDLSEEKLKCKNLFNSKNTNIINKEYKFIDLNNELKEKLIDINDYVRFINNNNEYVYVVLCNISFDKEILSNIKFNKLINDNATDIEKKFINKYSKIYNLIIINE